jgi:cephalosporin hydroxylase
VQGDVIEGGVNWGGGLMWFAQLSAALEPVNFQRRIIGFDTFSGFAGISDRDSRHSQNTEMKKGGFAAESYDDLLHNIALFDKNRFVNHIQKVMLVKGDVAETIPKFIEENPQQIVSLLHLDFDLYEPTGIALKHFLPRMSKGSVIIFDELNNLSWPGETTAVLEILDLSRIEIKRFPFEPHISYAVL